MMNAKGHQSVEGFGMRRLLSTLFTIVAILLIIGCGDGITGHVVGESFDEPECEALLAMLSDLKPDVAEVVEGSDEMKAYEIMYEAVVHKCRLEQSGSDGEVNN
jgi:hypothetical protein